MAQLSSYPSCCSAYAAVQFGQNFDSRSVQSVSQIKKDLTQAIEAGRSQKHHTVVTAIVIRMQKNAQKALEELGFKPASGWMTKPTRSDGNDAYAETTRASFAKSMARHTALREAKQLSEHDYEYYVRAYGPEQAESNIKAMIESNAVMDASNYERATRLYYLPLNGEEE